MISGRLRPLAALLAAILAMVVAGFLAAPAAAQRTTGREVVRTYNTAMRLLEEGKTREALYVVRKQLQSDNLTADERAVLTRFAGKLEAMLRGDLKLEDYEDYHSPHRDGISKEDNIFFLGRLYLVTEPPDYDKAVEAFRRYLEIAENPYPDAWYYLGQALAMKGECREAIPQAEKAVALAKEPDENHYRLLLHCHVELKNHDEVVRLAERMIELFGARDEYLKPLASAYRETGRGRDAFLTQAQRYELGLLDTEEELVGIAELYQIHENPHRAARILEKEMKAGRVKRTAKNLEKLGNMWFLAREYEKARNAWTSHTGQPRAEDDLKIARTYLEERKWRHAERHLRKALLKGGLKEPCHARILLGYALINQGREEEGKKYIALGTKAKECRAGGYGPWRISPYPEYLQIQRGPVISSFWRDVILRLQESAPALADDEDVLMIADEALSAAKAALAAETNKVRQRKLAEYERARFSARMRFDTGVLEKAREDRAAVEKILAEARTKDLQDNYRLLLKHLDETSKRRVEVLEQAQAKLKEAEKIAARARKKARKLAPSP